MLRRRLVCYMISAVTLMFHLVRNAPGVLVLFMAEEGALVDTLPKKAQFMGGFYIGYITTQLPGAALARAFGGKAVLQASIFGCAAAVAMAPWALRAAAAAMPDLPGSAVLAACMTLCGICQGPSLPAQAELLARWVPQGERAEMLGITRLGDVFSKVASAALLGGLAGWCGWRGALACLGLALGLVGAAWSALVHASPAECPAGGMDEAEREHLVRACIPRAAAAAAAAAGATTAARVLPTTTRGFSGVPTSGAGAADSGGGGGGGGGGSGTGVGVGVGLEAARKLRAFFFGRGWRSVACWGTVLAHFCHNVGSFVLKDWCALFYRGRFGMGKRSAASALALPYLLATAFQLLTKRSPARAQARLGWSAAQSRRACTTLAFVGAAPALLLVPSGLGGAAGALLAQGACCAVTTLHAAGYVAAYLDLGGGDAALLYAAGNTMASTAGFFAPRLAVLAMGRGSSANGGTEDWRALFGLVAVAYVVGAAAFLALARASAFPAAAQIRQKKANQF